MTRGLDVGTMTIISAEDEIKKGEIVHKDERDIFIELPKSATDAEQFMDMAGEKIVKINGKTYVVGKSSQQFASFLGLEYQRPLKDGMINPELGDESIIILNLLLKYVLGEPKEKDEVIAFSVPAAPIDVSKPATYHKETLKMLLTKLGYNAYPVNEATCVVYSHLMQNELTGIGISFGAGMANLSLAFKGFPVFEFSIARSGDWIDQQVQKATGRPTPEITYIKENEFSLNDNSDDRIKRYLRIYYEELIGYVIDKMTEKLNKSMIPPQLRPNSEKAQALRVVLAGGTASIPGFAELFRKKLESSNFPIKISDIFVPLEPLYVVSKGALQYAKTKIKK